jgi:hypothetical protein
MAVSEIPVQYRTTDGREFKTPGEAERHEKMLTAYKEYEDARQALGRCIAETQRTADGRLFEFTALRDYWAIWDRWEGIPRLVRVEFWPWNLHFEGDRDNFQLKGKLGDHDHLFRVSDLYANKDAAERALLDVQEKWLADHAEKVSELRERVIPTAKEWSILRGRTVPGT